MRELETDSTVIWPSWCYNTGENRLETVEQLKSRPLAKSPIHNSKGGKKRSRSHAVATSPEKRMNGLAAENRSPTFANACVSGSSSMTAAGGGGGGITTSAIGSTASTTTTTATVKMEVKTERLSPASGITDNNSSGSGSNTPSSSYPETPPGSGMHNDRVPSPSLSPAAMLPHSKVIDQPLARNYSDIMRSLAAKYNNSNPNDYFGSSKNGLGGTFGDPRFSSFKANPFAGLVAPLTSGSNSPPSALNSSCHLGAKDSSDADVPNPLFAGFGLNSFTPGATVPSVNLPLFSPLGDMNSTQALLNMVRTASSNAHLENYMKGSTTTATKRPSDLVNNPLDLSAGTPLPPAFKKAKRQSSCSSGESESAAAVVAPNSLKSKTTDRTVKRSDSVSPKPAKSVVFSVPSSQPTDRSTTCLSICTTSPNRTCPSRDDAVESVSDWSIDDVFNFVSSIDVCAEYAENFREQSIDGVSLPLLTEDHLRTTINMKLGPALKFRALLAQKIGHCTVCMHCLHCHNSGNSNGRVEGSVNSGHVPTSITNNGTSLTITAAAATVARPNSAVVSSAVDEAKRILKTGDVKKLEKFIRDGHGYELIGEYSFDPKIRNLLKSVPFYMARIDMLHDAVSRGQLRDVQILLNIVSPSLSLLKPKAENLVLSTDSAGAGLLHKAVFYSYPDMIEWLVRNYPATIQVRDKLGRIPLHYVNSTSEPNKYWQLLVSAGSPTNVKDVDDKTPRFYLIEQTEIHLPGRTKGCDSKDDDEFSVKSSNIRIWIHDQDIGKLKRVIWEGYGEKLKMQTSSKPTMRKLLNGVPHIMETIRQIHAAAVENDVGTLRKLCEPPVPRVIVKSKDTNGVTALHKACGLGHRQIVDFVHDSCPDAVHVCDNDGRMPIHYAASFNRQNVYEALMKYGANENIIDKNGKTAKCYLSRSGDIDQKLLQRMPSASSFTNVHSTFDWTLLQNANDGESKVVHRIEPQNSTLSSLKEEESIDLKGENNAPMIDSLANVEKTESINDPEDGVNVDTEKDVYFEVVQQAETEVDGAAENHQIDLTPVDNTIDQIVDTDVDDGQSNSTAICEDPKTDSTSTPTEDHASARVLTTRPSDLDSIPETDDDSLTEIRRYILEGHGELLVNSKSENPMIQQFLNHLPIYLKKIELIHYCCEIGDLDELRKCLDRRNMALARENKTGLYLTPLHVAVLNNRRHIARYLGGRFPETFKMADKKGRIPLHYAGMHPHGRYIYKLLLVLGADKTSKDDYGFTPEFYYENPGTHLDDVLKRVKKSKMSVDGRSELGSNDTNQFSEVYSEDSSIQLQDDKIARTATPQSRAAETVVDDNSRQSDAKEISYPNPSVIGEINKIVDVSAMNRSPTVVDQFQAISRDEYGQTPVHIAASKKHSRNAFLQMLKDLNISVAYRDELYQTARDVAALSELYDNVKAIDAFVLHIAANGETNKIIDLMTDGYDHVLDIESDENIMEVVDKRNQTKTMIVLQTITVFEEVRESLHLAIRQGSKSQVVEILRKCRKDASLLATCKNDMFRCSLHIAVLTERKDVVKFIIKKYPATLRIGDNLERTPLHYAMALSTVEELSRILIQAGASRTARDLKGRQPSYYFVEKCDILKMQREEKRLMEYGLNKNRRRLKR